MTQDIIQSTNAMGVSSLGSSLEEDDSWRLYPSPSSLRCSSPLEEDICHYLVDVRVPSFASLSSSLVPSCSCDKDASLSVIPGHPLGVRKERLPSSSLSVSDKPSKCSSSSFHSSQQQQFSSSIVSRGASWGGHRFGLRGGGDNSLSNGTSGWGPPPGASPAAAVGWGSTPSAPHPLSSAAWGNNANNPNASVYTEGLLALSDENAKSSSSPPGVSVGPSSSPPGGGTSWAAAAGKGLPPSEAAAASNSAASVIAAPSSVAAPSSANGSLAAGGSSTTKQQLEQLNSVREALFSQDGWGGSFVKQDTSWDTSVIGPDQMKEAAAAANTFSTHNGRRNDGTDIWKVNLSGQPPAPKPQPSNPWGHTPQNPTDFKNWGEEDEGHESAGGAPSSVAAVASAVPAREPLWRGAAPREPSSAPALHHLPQTPGVNGGQPAQFGGRPDKYTRPVVDELVLPPSAVVSKEDWHGPPAASWNDPRPSAPQPSQPRSDNPGWSNNGPAAAPPIRLNQWGGSNPGAANNNLPSGNNPGPTNNAAFIRAGWDGDSPTLSRRPVSHGGMDDGGTSLWGKIPPGPPVGTDRHDRNNSNWQDMPTPTPTRSGPPGPPSRLSMPGGPPGKDSSPWGAPIGHRISGGWGEDTPMKPSAGWGGMEMMDPPRDNGWGGEQWPGRPPRQSQIRVSPNWDEAADSGWGGQMKPRGFSKEFIWNSKQFRMLVEMGFDKNDIESALRRSHLNLEDAMDILRYNNGRKEGLFNEGGFDPMRGGRFPPGGGQMFNYSGANSGLEHGGYGGGGGPNFMLHGGNKMMNNGGGPPSSVSNNGPPRHLPNAAGNSASGSSGSSVAQAANAQQQPPSAQQLRILVQQIQMAVQAGHLNPQILNQPLAPQTLILLNQLLQQIKNLQTLQLAHSQKSVNPQMPGALLVNITKTKQMILNLQNQISAQQANYLKQQQQASSQQTPQQQQQAPSSHLDGGGGHLGGMSTMQDMFAGLGLNGVPNDGNSRLDNNSNNGSRLAQWKLTEDSFTKAPGSKLSSSNLLLDDGPWSNSAPGGWPEKQAQQDSSNAINGLDHFGISEFEPGKPWKGPGLKNPDDDPNLTPGSVAPSVLVMDVKVSAASSAGDNSLGLTTPTWTYSNNKAEGPKNAAPSGESTWGQPQSSSSSLTPMGQDLWGKAGRSGPPGLVNSNNGGSVNSNNSPASNGGGDKNWSSEPPAWLLLKNLTAQIDGATLKTLCLQHGPLKHFHLYLNHNLALVNYNSSREAVKAQNALNNCLLGNTTIMATFATDGEVSQILKQQQQQSQQGNGSSGSGSTPQTPSDNGGSNRGSTPSSSSTGEQLWGPLKVATSRAEPGAGSVWGNPLGSAGDDQHRILLPGDLGI